MPCLPGANPPTPHGQPHARTVACVKITCLVVTATLTLVGAPAVAAPYPVPNAKAEIEAAVSATNAAPSYQYRRNELGWTAVFNTAGQYQQRTTQEQRVFNGVGNFHEIDWPSTHVRDKVRNTDYLDSPSLQWEFTEGANDFDFPQWPDVLTERYGRIDSIPNRNSITVADKSVVGAETVYRVGDGDYFEYVYTVDAGGRIVRIELTRANREAQTGQYETWEYVPVTVVEPDPDSVLPIAIVRRAIQAATLNTTLRTLTKRTATGSNNSRDDLRTMRRLAREIVQIENATGEGSEDEPIARSVRIKTRNVAGGVRIFRKNPYTGTRHEWRVTKPGARWKAVKTLP